MKPIIPLMRQLNKTTHWEEFFIQESLELEEKMKTLDVESLSQSKLRICLEQGILDWAQYEKWYASQFGVSSLKSSMSHDEIEKLVKFAQATEVNYAQYEFWGADLIPLTVWDNQLIVLGLQYNEQLVTLGEPIFILTPPEILTSIKRKMADQKVVEESEQELNMESQISDALEGLNFNQAAPKISFTLLQTPSTPISETPLTASVSALEIPAQNNTADLEISIVTDTPKVAALSVDIPSAVSPIVASSPQPVTAPPSPPAQATPPPVQAAPATPSPQAASLSAQPSLPPQPPPAVEEPVNSVPSVFANLSAPDPAEGIWDFIAERHQEYTFEVRKQFDAFVVLKIANKKTQVFKMDADMTKQNVNHMIFEYNLEKDGPFKTIFDSKRSDSFSIQQLDMYLPEYQHACITPLMRGERVLGFFVGFKKTALSQKDKNLLEELAGETAS